MQWTDGWTDDDGQRALVSGWIYFGKIKFFGTRWWSVTKFLAQRFTCTLNTCLILLMLLLSFNRCPCCCWPLSPSIHNIIRGLKLQARPKEIHIVC